MHLQMLLCAYANVFRAWKPFDQLQNTDDQRIISTFIFLFLKKRPPMDFSAQHQEIGFFMQF